MMADEGMEISFSNVLAGQLAGVVSMQASGEPGKNSASDFYIRGIASFKGNSTPLVLDRKSTRLNSSHIQKSRMPSSA